MTEPPDRSPRHDAWTPALRPALLGWALARAAAALGYWAAQLLDRRVSLPDGRLHLQQGLLTWDAAIYRSIAADGYRALPREVVRFFPLHPLSGRWVGSLGIGPGWALVLLTQLAALVAAVLLWKLVADATGDRRLADRSAVLFSLWPAAVTLVLAYSEALFLCLALAALLAMWHRRPLLAVPVLFAAGLTRPTASLVVVAVALSWWERGRGERSETGGSGGVRGIAPWGLAVLAAPAGTAAYLWWLGATMGAASAPLDIQRELRAGFREPVTRLVTAAWDVVGGNFRQGYNVAFAVVAIALLVVAVRQRLPLAWTAYLAVGLVVALSANNIDSLGRYVLSLAPAWAVALAGLCTTRRRFVTIVAIGVVGSVWFAAAGWLGQMVP